MSSAEKGKIRFKLIDKTVNYYYSTKKNDFISANLVVPYEKEREFQYFEKHFECFSIENLSFIRIIKNINGDYSVQFIMNGANPFDRYKDNSVNGFYKNNPIIGVGKVGIDMGPKNIGVFSKTKQFYKQICEKSDRFDKEIELLQRKSDRQLRQNNLKCYTENGQYIPGSKLIKTKGWNKTQNKIRELYHKLSEYRKHSINNFIKSEILPLGNEFYIENTSQKSWQSQYGKSIGYYAPGFFIQQLKYNVEKYGGIVHVLPLNLALSQHCVCGLRKKKKLSERIHKCDVCGFTEQRDILSAKLATMCVFDKNKDQYKIDFNLLESVI
jgi:transposase